jgi:staphylococcal nuclease domain-containing protein 1
MQRDVEIEIDAVDKSGGFIGALYVNRTENAAVTLVKEGLATVHTFSAEGLSYAKQLFDAEVSVLIVWDLCMQQGFDVHCIGRSEGE